MEPLHLGPIRVQWVRVDLSQEARDDPRGGARCHVVGIVHHRPVERRVSLATAAALIARGVPSVVNGGARPVVPAAPAAPAARER